MLTKEPSAGVCKGPPAVASRKPDGSYAVVYCRVMIGQNAVKMYTDIENLQQPQFWNKKDSV